MKGATAPRAKVNPRPPIMPSINMVAYLTHLRAAENTAKVEENLRAAQWEAESQDRELE